MLDKIKQWFKKPEPVKAEEPKPKKAAPVKRTAKKVAQIFLDIKSKKSRPSGLLFFNFSNAFCNRQDMAVQPGNAESLSARLESAA